MTTPPTSDADTSAPESSRLRAAYATARSNRVAQAATSAGAPVPGWYPDPFDPLRTQRWWNGRDWSDFEAPLSSDALPWPASTLPAEPMPDLWKRLSNGRVDRDAGTNAAASISVAAALLGLGSIKMSR
ncbi:DUF2510 domain-containing protein [Microbacterium trichothecenolyticum]|uniref:DUF2510 domain-containing protein n=1 Tax=Microbacterium trichothecenolyticum TaxID=69370 RepID=UPI0009FEA3FC|nr:DUF2510 domain-containing protein [Microbacterium trichothecenolyticum]